jgi:hypothetical protein
METQFQGSARHSHPELALKWELHVSMKFRIIHSAL